MKNKNIYLSKRNQILHHPGGHDHERASGDTGQRVWLSGSVPNPSDKLKRGSLRYGEAVELADVLGYDIIWQRRGKEGR